ncbi:MAG: hypothetical protein CVU79_03655 [Elusimicrobia bacterium HGW-Elusimicrobia-3]|nr:MAG: hypothetical protein CVU79_03655 [Elusimicrobia bacterium HGW-Elusimicrobia-3]
MKCKIMPLDRRERGKTPRKRQMTIKDMTPNCIWISLFFTALIVARSLRLPAFPSSPGGAA